jgi:manganese transport protein
MNSVLELTLGVMTALGGFVDVGELVFAVQAGAKFGYLLLWAIVLGTVGIVIFGEMAGRIAAVRHEPVFLVMRKQLGFRAGLVALVASTIVNLLTCAAEVGGVAAMLELLLGSGFRAMVVVAAVLLLVLVYVLPFRWIERVFGLFGLTLLVYLAAALTEGPDWGEAARGLLPQLPRAGQPGLAVYLYFATGLISSIMMPYEVHFYSSGGIEDHWTPKDLPVNKVTAGFGFVLGGVLTMALTAVGALAYLPQDIDPQRISSSVLGATHALGRTGLYLALAGIFFAVGGAAVETALAGGYNVAQFFGWPWGKSRPPRDVPAFTATWMLVIVLAAAIALAGWNPVEVVEFAVIAAIVVLPFTYYPILRLADDAQLMGKHVNSPLIKWLGWAYFAVIVVVALAAVPLMVITHLGQG